MAINAKQVSQGGSVFSDLDLEGPMDDEEMNIVADPNESDCDDPYSSSDNSDISDTEAEEQPETKPEQPTRSTQEPTVPEEQPETPAPQKELSVSDTPRESPVPKQPQQEATAPQPEEKKVTQEPNTQEAAKEGPVKKQSPNKDNPQKQEEIVLDVETIKNLSLLLSSFEEMQVRLEDQEKSLLESQKRTEEYFKRIAEESSSARNLARTEKVKLTQAIAEGSVEAMKQAVNNATKEISDVAQVAESHLQKLEQDAVERNKRFLKASMPEKVLNYMKYVAIIVAFVFAAAWVLEKFV